MPRGRASGIKQNVWRKELLKQYQPTGIGKQQFRNTACPKFSQLAPWRWYNMALIYNTEIYRNHLGDPLSLIAYIIQSPWPKLKREKEEWRVQIAINMPPAERTRDLCVCVSVCNCVEGQLLLTIYIYRSKSVPPSSAPPEVSDRINFEEWSLSSPFPPPLPAVLIHPWPTSDIIVHNQISKTVLHCIYACTYSYYIATVNILYTGFGTWRQTNF